MWMEIGGKGMVRIMPHNVTLVGVPIKTPFVGVNVAYGWMVD